jgi:hypothetical protein
MNTEQIMADLYAGKEMPSGLMFSFGTAIEVAKTGQFVRRRAWPEDDYLFAAPVSLDPNNPEKTVICQHLSREDSAGWTPTQEDMFAEDWEFTTA